MHFCLFNYWSYKHEKIFRKSFLDIRFSESFYKNVIFDVLTPYFMSGKQIFFETVFDVLQVKLTVSSISIVCIFRVRGKQIVSGFFSRSVQIAKDPMFLHADSEDSDQTGRTGHFVGFVVLWLICIPYSNY